MYEAYYNFTCLPFHNTPNPRFFFETDQHKEALAKLEYTVRNKRGFALITGDIGAGKTTLSRTLIRRLGTQARVAMINNTRLTSKQLLELIAHEWGLDVAAGPSKVSLLRQISSYVQYEHTMGRNCVVIIDEGQCLNIDEFEEIRLLTNLETETDKLVQLLILGQPELRETLKHPRLAPLIQRIVMYMHLKPMHFDDMIRYIAFRLARASHGKPNVDFSREALKLIFDRAQGIPRLVNLICDNALLVGYSRDSHLINSSIVESAVSQMLPNFHMDTHPTPEAPAPPEASNTPDTPNTIENANTPDDSDDPPATGIDSSSISDTASGFSDISPTSQQEPNHGRRL